MTEREKASKEMLNELEMWFDHEQSWLSSKAKALEIVGRLGYRKEEEVQKETGKAVFYKCKELSDKFDGAFIDLRTLKRVILEVCGVEAEE